MSLKVRVSIVLSIVAKSSPGFMEGSMLLCFLSMM